jgi:hypothetical protein
MNTQVTGSSDTLISKADASPPPLTPGSSSDDIGDSGLRVPKEMPQSMLGTTPTELSVTSNSRKTCLIQFKLQAERGDDEGCSPVKPQGGNDWSTYLTPGWLSKYYNPPKSMEFKLESGPFLLKVSSFNFTSTCRIDSTLTAKSIRTSRTTEPKRQESATIGTTGGVISKSNEIGNSNLATRRTALSRMQKTNGEQVTAVLRSDLLTRIHENNKKCVAEISKKPTRRCTKQLGQTVSPKAIASALSQALGEQTPITALRHLDEILLPLLFCKGGHHLRQASSRVERILASIDVTSAWDSVIGRTLRDCIEEILIVEEAGAKTTSTTSHPARSAKVAERRQMQQRGDATDATSTYAADASPTMHCSTLTAARTRGRKSLAITTTAAAAAATTGDQLLTLTSAYKPYHSPNSIAMKQSLTSYIRSSLNRPLLPTERSQAGYIYIYWKPGTFGKIKIGYTTNTTSKRLQEWSSRCGGSAAVEGCCMEDQSLHVKVRHVRRVEALVHAELRDHRRKQVRGDCICGKEHKEWFETNVNHAQKVVRKWTAWMDEKPRYQEDSFGVWKLMENISEDEIGRLCTPVIWEVQEKKPRSLRRKEGSAGTRRPSSTTKPFPGPGTAWEQK